VVVTRQPIANAATNISAIAPRVHALAPIIDTAMMRVLGRAVSRRRAEVLRVSRSLA